MVAMFSNRSIIFYYILVIYLQKFTFPSVHSVEQEDEI